MLRMKQVELKPYTPVTCSRCGKTEFLQDAAEAGWNLETRGGYVVAFLCHDCQTDAENLEAMVNEATIDYSTDEHGRLTGRSKAAM